MRIVTLLLLTVVFLSPASSGQQITPAELDAPYALLDLAETETGILADRRSLYLDPLRYAGGLDADTLVPMQWEILYGQLRMSAADPSVFPSAANLAAVAHGERTAGRLPIAILWQPFDYIDGSALDDGRLELDESGSTPQYVQPEELEGRSLLSPYLQSQVFAAAALWGDDVGLLQTGPASAGAVLTFSLPSDLFVLPPGVRRPKSVQMDLDDGAAPAPAATAEPVQREDHPAVDKAGGA